MPEHEKVMSCQVKSGEDMSGQVTSCHVRTGQDKSSRIISRLCEVRSGQVWRGSIQVK